MSTEEKTHTRIKVRRDLWKVVKMKSAAEDKTKHEVMEEILADYIEDHGQEYGYSLPADSAEPEKEDEL